MALPIRLRLALVAASLIAGLVSGVGAVVYLRLEADLAGAVDDGLAERAQELLDDPPTGSVIPISTSDIGDVFAALVGPGGRIVASTPGFPTAVVGPTALTAVNGARSFERLVSGDEEPTPVRLYAAPAGDAMVVLTGVAFDDQRAALTELRTELLVALPLAVALALVAGWLVGRAAMRPVDRMRIEAEAISVSDLNRRLPVARTRDELEALGRSLNRMLERVETAVERERRLVDDASHELRTPLANLKAELELAVRRARTEGELQDSLRSALEETDRLARLAADLLVLARAHGGRLPVHPELVDLGTLVAEAIDRAASRASAQGVRLEAAVEPGLEARLDPARAAQALDNLVDNALRQSQLPGVVTISAESTDGSLRLAVSDSGAGFPADFLDRAFEPFSRSDAARTRTDGGAGLGLAIVRTIAEAHGGSVRAANRAEGGAVVELSIPA
jgi:signal transduction histidine kinase